MIDTKAQALIFDLDGTLANSMPIHYEAWSKVAGHHGFSFTEDYFYRNAGVPTYQIAKQLTELNGLSVDPELLMEEQVSNFLSLEKETQPIDIIIKVARENHGKMPIACGTGNIRKIVTKTLNDLDLNDFFDIVVTADDVSKHKPDPETFLSCADFMGVDPSKCQVFEDGEPGLLAARRAGMIATDIRPFLVK